MGIFKGIKKAFKGIGKIFGSVLKLGIGGIGALLSGFGPQKMEMPDAPEVTPPTVMPLPDDDFIEKIRRRSLAERISRRGRQSTILTDSAGSDSLG